MDIIADAVSAGAGAAELISGGLSQATTSISDAFTRANQQLNGITGISVSAVKFNFDSGIVTIGASFQAPGVGPVGLNIQYDPAGNTFNGSILTVAGRAVPFDPSNLGATIDYAMEHSLDWIPNFGLVERVFENDYADIFSRLEQEYGPGNVYLASEEFVSWACPTTVGRDVIAIIISEGAAADVIIDGVKARAIAESELIKKWLAEKAQAIDLVAVVQRLLNGENPTNILPQLYLRWQNIEYRSHIKIAGQDIQATNIPETHWGFVIIWKENQPLTFTRLPSQGVFQTRSTENSPPTAKWRLGIKPQYTQFGCLVLLVSPNSAADRAGICVGETITSIDGNPVGNIGGRHWVLWRVIELSSTGVVNIALRNDVGQTRTLTVTLDRNL